MITKLTGTQEEKYLLKARELYSRALNEVRQGDTVKGSADTVMASVSKEDADALLQEKSAAVGRIKSILESEQFGSNMLYRPRINDSLRSAGITDAEIKAAGLDALDKQHYYSDRKNLIDMMESYDPFYNAQSERKKAGAKKLAEQPNEDSEGNPISAKQKKYFADSVVREIEDYGGNRWDVESDSKLMPVYHATYSDFSKFDKKRLGEMTEGNTDNEEMIDTARIGFWFSTKDLTTYKKDDNSFVPYPGAKAIKSYINITNPKVYSAVYELADSIAESGGRKQYLAELK
jgi:hypothetical protein